MMMIIIHTCEYMNKMNRNDNDNSIDDDDNIDNIDSHGFYKRTNALG